MRTLGAVRPASLLVLLGLLHSPPIPAASPSTPWLTDLGKATELAAASNRALLIVFR